MKFSEKYRHVGYSYPGVPKHWQPIVERAVVDIEKEMWVRWLPMFMKRWVHYLATGNSVVRVKYWWAVRLRNRLTHGGQMIHDIKDKYATLRIYGSFCQPIDDIIERAEKECLDTCEKCGSHHNTDEHVVHGWVFNLCEECRNGIDTKEEEPCA